MSNPLYAGTYELGEVLPKYTTGQRVKKTSGDYTYEGEVVGVIRKKSGAVRYVVEDDRGLLFIFNEGSLQPV